MTGGREEAGFTLTEVLVALAILALAAAVSLPAIRNRGGERQLDLLTQEIASALRMTRDAAAAGNRERQLVVDLELRAIAWPSGAPIKLPEALEAEITSAASDAGGKVAKFKFFPDGGSTGGRIVLKLNGASREIALNWLTGAVAVLEEGAK